ncbi:hypothetical protein MTR_0054s0250 [Medicago truncatula]|uniref:Uncharacterized protein n=1 Tax=Medicago truncatula TaxID=3880 RepID=A0A072TTX9_MEDTR|nr:hypothetical protein MTR_0054s0250 [Medicago truncatula]
MAAGSLDYSVRKRLDTQHLRDMAQLVDRVRHVERLKAENARTHKHFREMVAYIASDESNQEFDIAFGDVEIKELQKALNEGRLKFGNKPKPQMQVDSDSLKEASMMYTDIAGSNMVEAIIDVFGDLSVEAEFDEKIKTTYPTAEEELIDFLNRCKLKNSEVMLCPRGSAVFDKMTSKGLEGSTPKPKKRGKWSGDHRP